MDEFIEGVCAIAEFSVLYYQTCIKAGATEREAERLTKMYIELIYDKFKRRPSDNDEC